MTISRQSAFYTQRSHNMKFKLKTRKINQVNPKEEKFLKYRKTIMSSKANATKKHKMKRMSSNKTMQFTLLKTYCLHFKSLKNRWNLTYLKWRYQCKEKVRKQLWKTTRQEIFFNEVSKFEFVTLKNSYI